MRFALVSACLPAAASVALALSPATIDAASTPDWLGRVDAYRASAALPSVVENGTMDLGDADHSKYMVENQTIGHSEDPTKPFYSSAGSTAASQSDVMVDYTTATSDTAAVDLWMTGVFHAIGVLDPGLTQTGFGSYRQSGAGMQMGAALNVIGGLGHPASGTVWPVVWPGNGSTVPLTTYRGGEAPDPLSGCPNYSAPTGAPIIIQFGPTGASITSYGLSQGGVSLPVCELDGGDYANPDSNQQSEGRAVLAARNAMVLIPRAPLVAGTPYTVNLISAGRAISWSFSVDPNSDPTTATPADGAAAVGAPSVRRAPAPVVRPPAPAAPRPVQSSAPKSPVKEPSSPSPSAAATVLPTDPASPPSELALALPHPPAGALGAPLSAPSSGTSSLTILLRIVGMGLLLVAAVALLQRHRPGLRRG